MLNKNLSRFQRRSLQLLGSCILFTAALTTIARECFNRYHPRGSVGVLFALLPSLPFLATIVVAMRYLAHETDEFIRAQVLSSLLHGALITLVLTVVYGFLENFLHIPAPPAMAYIDIFLVASIFSLRYHLRSNQ